MEIAKGFFSSEKRKLHAFDHVHGKILKKYGTDIPVVSPSLRVSTVIPCFAELKNDNFWRLLRSACLQRNIGCDSFELIFVVNNPSYTAHDHTPRQEETYLENQQLLELLNIIKGGANREIDKENAVAAAKIAYPPLTEHEANILRLAIDKRVQAIGVDASAKGRSLSSNPIGTARNIGAHIAFERLGQVNPDRGIIDFIDGDCFLPPNYYQALCVMAETQGEVFIKALVTETPEYPRELEENNTPTSRIIDTLSYYASSIFNMRKRYLAEQVVKNDKVYPFQGGPALSVKPKRFRAVGGYPCKHNEDYFFSSALICKQAVRVRYLEDSWVYLSDRSRAESTDGKDRTEVSSREQLAGIKAMLLFSSGDSISRHRRIMDKISRQRLDELLSLNEYMEGRYGDVYREMRAKFFKRENRQRIFFLEWASKIISIAVSGFDPATEHARLADYLSANPLLITLVEDILALYKIPEVDPCDTVRYFLEEFLPEYFSNPPTAEPDYTPDKTQKGCFNIRDYIHIAEAAFFAQAKSRNVI